MKIVKMLHGKRLNIPTRISVRLTRHPMPSTHIVLSLYTDDCVRRQGSAVPVTASSLLFSRHRDLADG